MIIRTTQLALLTTLFVFTGCDEDDDFGPGVSVAPDAGAAPTTADAAEPAPTWTQVYTTVILARCSPCHTTTGGIGIVGGQLDMTTQSGAFAHLLNVPASGSECAGSGRMRVVPGMAHDSLLYLKVSLDDPNPCGDKMPLGGPSLSEEDAEMIEDWIDSGAPNN